MTNINLIDTMKKKHPDTAGQINAVWNAARIGNKTAFADALGILLRRAKGVGIDQMLRKEAKDEGYKSQGDGYHG